MQVFVNNPVIFSFYPAVASSALGVLLTMRIHLRVSQRNFLNRADSSAPDSLAIPVVQVVDSLVGLNSGKVPVTGTSFRTRTSHD